MFALDYKDFCSTNLTQYHRNNISKNYSKIIYLGPRPDTIDMHKMLTKMFHE